MKRFAFLLSLLCLFTTLSSGATKPKVVEAYGKRPLSFEANQGQSNPRVKFLSRGSGYTLFLTSTDAVLFLQEGAPPRGVEQQGSARIDESVLPHNPNRRDDVKTKSAVLRIKLLGANVAPQLTGLDDLPGKANYFIGNDPKKWRKDVPTYAKVKYHAVYPGVDLVYYGNQRQLEHDFIVAPGADPGLISLRLEGAKKVSLDSHGDLVLKTQNGEVRFQKPVIYQEVDGVRQEIAGGYKLKGKNRVGFEVATYDAMKQLVIDPTLVYSTYIGGSDFDEGYGIAVDSAGSAYVTGSSGSSFPTTLGASQTTYGGGSDAFVAKLSADGSSLVYSTYLGGGGFDRGQGIAVDSAGNAYVIGFTNGSFPTTSGASQTTFGGGNFDYFVSKLSADGSSLVYSSYLGGPGNDVDIASGGGAIAVDSVGNAYVTGYTDGSFPTTPGSFQTTYGGGDHDAFVTKLSADGSSRVYSTYLGGSGLDVGRAIAVNSTGNAYVTGFTVSNGVSGGFPITSGAFQTTCIGTNAFVTKLTADGSSLVYSTHLGAGGYAVASGIAVDSAGNAYTTGYIDGTFPTTSGAYQTTYGGGGGDTYITKLNAAGSSLIYSTYVGGIGYDYPLGIAIDSTGNAYVAGLTNGSFPTTSEAPQMTFGGWYDAFVSKLSADGSSLVYSTYLGGSGYDLALGIAVDSASNAYVTGYTSGSFPATSGAYQTTFGGGGAYDAFVTKITDIVLNAFVQPPINPDGTSVFRKATKGVVVIKFTLTSNGTATCQLSPATISVTRTSGGTIGPVDESVYETAADTGSDFRISGCQYVYNLAASSLGVGTYRVDISINGAVVGSGIFGLT
jgi:hypothetical protein